MLISLTAYDPKESQEGKLDPLGLNTIGDRLATMLVPGVRERMSHPRFLTAMAVGAEICRGFSEEIAADKTSPAYIVYEWLVVQGLYRETRRNEVEISGLPGSFKAREAYNKRESLSAKKYLMSPLIFGFHGVYKTLAKELDVVTDGRLGENGDRLLRVWEREQNLTGFYDSDACKGNGRDFKIAMRNAVRKGLDKGQVACDWNWKIFGHIALYLNPLKPGKMERELLSELLMSDEYREEVVRILPKFLDHVKQTDLNEKTFHDYLKTKCSVNLIQLLEAIQSYEMFCSYLQSYFNSLLYYLSDKHRRVAQEEIMKQPFAGIDGKTIRSLYYDASQKLSALQSPLRQFDFEQQFKDFAYVENDLAFFQALLSHHSNVQKKKPPFGKNVWIEHCEDGSVMIRPLYRVDDKNELKGRYVNSYRTVALISFLRDLKRI